MDKKDEQTVETPRKKANKAVHTAALGAATVAATPIPFADAVALMPIQTAMIVQIYRAYGKKSIQGHGPRCTQIDFCNDAWAQFGGKFI